MKHPVRTTALALLLSLIFVFAIGAETPLLETHFSDLEQYYQTRDEARMLAPGIVEDRILINDDTGRSQRRIYTVTVDTKAEGVGFLAGYADYQGDYWKMQSLRDQAAIAGEKTGRNIVAAFNADIYDMVTGEPNGALVMQGHVYKAGLGQPYFGVTKSGEVKMGWSLTQEILDEMQECTGAAWAMLVENGQRTWWTSNSTRPAPRAAVGLKADGSFVFVSVDGRNFPFSDDTSEYDLGTIMLGLGCVMAINLDGGGSSTYMSKGPEDDYLKVVNHPSDAVERIISSTFFITYDGPAFEAPAQAPHEHEYVYADGKLTCECGDVRETAGYTGLAKDGPTGRTRFFLNGKVKKKWMVYGTDCYYFDDDGLGHVGPLTTRTNSGSERNYVFDEQGRQIGFATVYAAAGFPRAYFADGMTTGWYTLDGHLRFSFDKGTTFDKRLREMYGYPTYYAGILMGGKREVFVPTRDDGNDNDVFRYTYTFDDDGNLIEGARAEVDGHQVYYWGYERYIGWTEIGGETYYFAPPCGFMATGETEVDGEKCTFDADGRLQHGHGKHSFGDWTVTKAPTAAEEGEETRECVVCHEKETRPVEKLAVALGDVDSNGEINAADARLALRRAVELEKYEPGSAEFAACDVDKNNEVTAADARLILRAAVELEDPTKW